MIYPEVEKWALHPSSIPRGEMRMVEKTDPKSGQHTTEFFGRDSFIKGMSRPGRKVRRLIAADSKTGVRTVLWGKPEETL